MCVAFEGVVVSADRLSQDVTVDYMGSRIHARGCFIPVKPGDHVMVHAGCVIQKVTRDEHETMTDLNDLLREVGAF